MPLHHTLRELQVLNQALLEMSAARESRVPADPQKGPPQRARSETSAIPLVSKQQVELLLRQFASLQEEHQRLRRQTRTEECQAPQSQSCISDELECRDLWPVKRDLQQ